MARLIMCVFCARKISSGEHILRHNVSRQLIKKKKNALSLYTRVRNSLSRIYFLNRHNCRAKCVVIYRPFGRRLKQVNLPSYDLTSATFIFWF